MLPLPQEREEAMADTRGSPSYTLRLLAWQAGPLSVPVSRVRHITSLPPTFIRLQHAFGSMAPWMFRLSPSYRQRLKDMCMSPREGHCVYGPQTS